MDELVVVMFDDDSGLKLIDKLIDCFKRIYELINEIDSASLFVRLFVGKGDA